MKKTGIAIIAVFLWPLFFATAVVSGQTGAIVTELQQIARMAQDGDHRQAVQKAQSLLAKHPMEADAYYLLGRSLFCLGKVNEAVGAFDQYVARRPELEARQWERGIALYYAGRYEAAARQFELYQSYHAGDVENAVWHYLCRSAIDGPMVAQRRLLPVEGDNRIPMQEIYALYGGSGSAERVLAAVEAGKPDQEQRMGRLFYAHLYVGLYYHAWGRPEEALRYLALADKEHVATRSINRYMWWVAHVHVHYPANRHPGEKEAAGSDK